VRVLITGNGSSGSWGIRGDQLGGAIGADVIPRATSVTGYDVCVIVKRHPHSIVQACRDARVPLVWDVVDPWPQPRGNNWSEDEAKAWLHTELMRVNPVLAIAATHRMAADIRAMGWRSVCVPHHAHPAITRNGVRPEVSVVGYEGSLSQLGAWIGVVQAECDRRGWRFVLNGDYRTYDIVLGLREATGYPASAWKSCVKLANAQAASVPFVGSLEWGYAEIRVPGIERFVQSPGGLRQAFDALAPEKERRRVADWMATTAPLLTLENAATQYRAVLREVVG
jgi:hypothetical protein